MTFGIILMVYGTVQTAWMIWRIRTYVPDPSRVSRFEMVMHDIGRTTPRPKSRLTMSIERYSYWYGLVGGVLIFAVGLAFMISE